MMKRLTAQQRMDESEIAPYLFPYHRAAQRHGGEFEALCWTSLAQQTVRFDAMIEVYDFADKRMIDAGCGRADFFDHLAFRHIIPAKYLGVEAISPLALRAKHKTRANFAVLQADFLMSGFPSGFFPDVIVFSGTLNTFRVQSCQIALNSALRATRDSVVFNFLCKPDNADVPWLASHTPNEIRSLIKSASCTTSFYDGYLDGDITAVVKRTS
jgi:hypothetical protein